MCFEPLIFGVQHVQPVEFRKPSAPLPLLVNSRGFLGLLPRNPFVKLGSEPSIVHIDLFVGNIDFLDLCIAPLLDSIEAVDMLAD
jgi:hypothetical protein